MYMNSYTKRHIAIVLLVCLMVATTLSIGGIIDAKPKKKDGSTFWEDVTDLLDLKDILEPILKRIGAIRKTVEELERDQLLHKAHALQCDRSAQLWEAERDKAYKIIEDACIAYNNALTAKNDAEDALQSAIDDINTANAMLQYYAYLSQLGSGSEYSDEIDYWIAKKREAMNRKSTAEADIAMHQSTMDSEKLKIEAGRERYLICNGMVIHFRNRELYHDAKVAEIQIKIDALNAEEIAKEQEKQKIEDDYAKKDKADDNDD